ncbi:MAG: hypothetical protein Ct9H90mP8_1020 [Pseudomonadota bacterium]|nr:MAG: hypothetical protein Ct9H90mP8_1020 [Pseudomonadota bacterium]
MPEFFDFRLIIFESDSNQEGEILKHEKKNPLTPSESKIFLLNVMTEGNTSTQGKNSSPFEWPFPKITAKPPKI